MAEIYMDKVREWSGSSSKKGIEIEKHEMMPSPQKKKKKTKGEKVSRITMERKEKAAKKLRKMSIRERCLMMERTVYAEEELHEVSIEYQDMWDYMERISAGRKQALLARNAGSPSQGGGSWPSTVA